MSRKQAELLLAAVIIIRATSYLFSKTALYSLEPFNLLAIRFLLAFVLLCFITRRHMAGLFCALNPLTASVLGVLVLHETFGLQSLIGGLLVLAGILLSKIGDRKDAAETT